MVWRAPTAEGPPFHGAGSAQAGPGGLHHDIEAKEAVTSGMAKQHARRVGALTERVCTENGAPRPPEREVLRINASGKGSEMKLRPGMLYQISHHSAVFITSHRL